MSSRRHERGARAIDIRDAYLDHMMEAAAYLRWERPREDASCASVQAGWSFITFEETLKDEVYRLKYDYVGVQGAGHLDAIKPAVK